MCSNITCACLKWLYVYLFFAFFCNCSWFLFFLSFDSVLCELFLQFRISNQIRFFSVEFCDPFEIFFFLSRRYMYGIYEYKCIHLLKMWSMCRKNECNLSKYQNENLCTSMHISFINSSNDDSMYMRSFFLVRSISSCSFSLCHSQSMCLR